MDSCPPEIHAHIFSLACTDDGKTGCSLSSVSRYVRLVSAPYQWRNLVLSGLPRVKRFAATLNAFILHSSSTSTSASTSLISPSATRPISHLFLSNRIPPCARDRRTFERHAVSHLPERTRIDQAFDSEAAEFAHAVHQILVYASPSLRTLTLMCYDVHLSPKNGLKWDKVFGEQMPKLEEVTIRGGFYEGEMSMREFGDLGGGGHGSENISRLESISGHLDPGRGNVEYSESSEPTLAVASSAKLPSLKRLHLISPTPFEPFIRKIQPLAPSLSHTRLSDLKATDYNLACTIFSELVERDVAPSALPGLDNRQWSSIPTASPMDWPPILPRHGVLERLIMQPSALPPKPEKQCGCCSGYYQLDDTTRLLREMARQSNGDTFVFLPARHRGQNASSTGGFSGGGYSYEEALGAWGDRACGDGQGCWTQKNDVDIDVPGEDASKDMGWEEVLVQRRAWTVDRSVLRYLLDTPTRFPA